jgi:hypothetical protein
MPPEKIPAQQAPAPVTGMPETGKETKAPPAFELKGDEKPKEKKAKEFSPVGAKNGTVRDEGDFTFYKENDVIVTVPKGATGKMPVTVVYGGLTDRGGEKENMYKWTPKSQKTSQIMVFADWFTGFVAGVKPVVASVAAQAGVEAEYKNLLGFSKGGERVNMAKGDAAWKTIGLIDPSVSGYETYPCPAYMVWDNWKDLSVDQRKKLHDRIKKGDVTGDSKRFEKLGHKKMPEQWFTEFGSML